MTPDGALAALVVGMMVVGGLGWRGAVVLLAFFVSGSLWSQLASTREPIARTYRQVIANGGVAAVAALFGSWSAFAGALSASTADTWATEVGSFARAAPRMITSGKPVQRGVSGGVTLLGTTGGVLGAAFIALLGRLIVPSGYRFGAASIALAGIAGMFADSLLGATLQGAYICPICGTRVERATVRCHEPVQRIKGAPWMDNDMVNLLGSLVGAGVALVLT